MTRRGQPDRPRISSLGARILHLDREIVVVVKPAGVLTVPFDDRNHETLHGWVGRAIRRRLKRHLPPVRVVQRLDKDTSGVVVFARTRRAERVLQQQFRRHTVDRRYLALAHGVVRGATHETILVRDRGDGLRGSWRHRRSPPPSGRKAITHVEVLRTFDVPASLRTGAALRLSLVSCRLETGRQHQIRIHLAESGHPVVGEKVYVREYVGASVRGFDAKKKEGRTLLHAERLGFVHPADQRPRTFVEPVPADFATLLDQLENSTIPRG